MAVGAGAVTTPILPHMVVAVERQANRRHWHVRAHLPLCPRAVAVGPANGPTAFRIRAAAPHYPNTIRWHVPWVTGGGGWEVLWAVVAGDVGVEFPVAEQTVPTRQPQAPVYVPIAGHCCNWRVGGDDVR